MESGSDPSSSSTMEKSTLRSAVVVVMVVVEDEEDIIKDYLKLPQYSCDELKNEDREESRQHLFFTAAA